MSLSIPAFIFDLDGTLTDSKPGILGCLSKAIAAHGIVNNGPLDRFVGPPVEDWAIELLPNGSDEQRAALARDYRACYNVEGWSNNSVFHGIFPMLDALRAAGHALYVCTSKQQRFATRILDHFGLSERFIAVYGDKSEYESHQKADLLARLLHEQGLVAAEAWMVGDRTFDIVAAHANSVRCVAAAWGYGSAEEWALADAVATTPAAVAALASAPDRVSSSR